jgi:hypothetical protein
MAANGAERAVGARDAERAAVDGAGAAAFELPVERFEPGLLIKRARDVSLS